MMNSAIYGEIQSIFVLINIRRPQCTVDSVDVGLYKLLCNIRIGPYRPETFTDCGAGIYERYWLTALYEAAR